MHHKNASLWQTLNPKQLASAACMQLLQLCVSSTLWHPPLAWLQSTYSFY
jgi:hypothetical protein